MIGARPMGALPQQAIAFCRDPAEAIVSAKWEMANE
jgi:hypothetical protein